MSMEPKRRLTDEEYKYVFERAVRLCLDFVVVKDGKILLAKRAIEPHKGSWALSGGVVRRKESIDEAADRILMAELGLKPMKKELIGYIEFPDEINQNGVGIHSVSIAFLTTLEEGVIKTSDQAQEIEFFAELPEKMHPIHGKFLQENWHKIR